MQQLKAAKYSSAAKLLALQTPRPTASGASKPNYRLSSVPLNELQAVERSISDTMPPMERQRLQADAVARASQNRQPYPMAIASSHVGPFSETGRSVGRSLSHPSARRESRSESLEAVDAPLANPIALRSRWDLRNYRRALLNIDAIDGSERANERQRAAALTSSQTHSDVLRTSKLLTAVAPSQSQAQSPSNDSNTTLLYSEPTALSRSTAYVPNPYERSAYCSLPTFSNSRPNL